VLRAHSVDLMQCSYEHSVALRRCVTTNTCCTTRDTAFNIDIEYLSYHVMHYNIIVNYVNVLTSVLQFVVASVYQCETSIYCGLCDIVIV